MALTTDPSVRRRNGLHRSRDMREGTADSQVAVADAPVLDLEDPQRARALTTTDIPSRTIGNGAWAAEAADVDATEREALDSAAPAGADANGSATQVRRLSVPWSRRYVRRLLITDVIALVWAGLGVHLIELPTRPTAVSSTPSYLPFIAATVLLVGAWLVALAVSGSRDPKAVRSRSGRIQARHPGFAERFRPGRHRFVPVPVGPAAQLPGHHAAGRPGRAAGVPVPVATLAASPTRRRPVHVPCARRRRLGTPSSSCCRTCDRAPRAGYRVVGVCVGQDPRHPEQTATPVVVDGVPILGVLDQVAEVARTSGADTVAVTSTAAFGPSAVRRLSWQLEDTDAELILAPALTNIAGPRIHTQPVAGLPLIHVDRPTYRGANRILKKSFDLVGSAAAVAAVLAAAAGGRARHQTDQQGPGVLPSGARRASTARRSG